MWCFLKTSTLIFWFEWDRHRKCKLSMHECMYVTITLFWIIHNYHNPTSYRYTQISHKIEWNQCRNKHIPIAGTTEHLRQCPRYVTQAFDNTHQTNHWHSIERQQHKIGVPWAQIPFRVVYEFKPLAETAFRHMFNDWNRIRKLSQSETKEILALYSAGLKPKLQKLLKLHSIGKGHKTANNGKSQTVLSVTRPKSTTN